MKTKMKRIMVLLLSLALALSTLVGCQSSGGKEASASSEEYTIPVLSAVTGVIAYVGKPASWAAEYAAEIINSNGGINGKNLKVEISDTKFDTAEAVSCMSQVVDDSLVVIGPMDSPGAEAVGQLAADALVANIAAYTNDSVREQYSPYAIGYMTDADEDWTAVQKWVECNPDIKKMVLFENPTDYSQVETVELLKKNLPTIGVEVVKVVDIETDTLDCGPAAVQAINAGADAYYVNLRADEASKVVTELRARGVKDGSKICANFASFNDNYLTVTDAAALDGTFIWNKLDPNYEGEEWQTLMKEYQKDFDGASPTTNTVSDFYNAVIAVKQCFEELKITGDSDKLEEEKAAITEWFYNSPVIHGIQGDFQWIKGKKVAPVYMFQFDGTTPNIVK